eukprot:1148859-Pelagomonas_calceolata.AAC.6
MYTLRTLYHILYLSVEQKEAFVSLGIVATLISEPFPHPRSNCGVMTSLGTSPLLIPSFCVMAAPS